MKAKLILVVSSRMDSNKKPSRNEDGLIRMGETARAKLGLTKEKTVELYPQGPVAERITRSKVVEIFKAYSADLKQVKLDMPEECDQVGFVTSRTFDIICGDRNKQKESVWISDSVEDLVIGGDPEFMLFKGSRIQYAAEVDGFSHADILGSDGPLAEIRPAPAMMVEEFIGNIQDILRNHKNTKVIAPFEWVSGCYYYGAQVREDVRDRPWPVGGHIHIGMPKQLIRAFNNNSSEYKNMIYSCLCRALDELVAVPMMKIDGLEKSVQRRMQYGKFGHWREQVDRVEYRTLSGEWMNHPKMAWIVINVVKAIAHDFLRRLSEKDFDWKLVGTKQEVQNGQRANRLHPDFNQWNEIPILKSMGITKGTNRMLKILHEGSMKFTQNYIKSLHNHLKKLSTYKQYQDPIDAFIALISQSHQKLAEMDRDLKHTWVGNQDFIL
jgi:hypothetical protein